MRLLNGDMRIELTQGKYAIVDAVDFPRLSTYKWYYLNGYAIRTNYEKGKSVVRMHREIMDTPFGMVCDHIDGDGLNNRRTNLRNCLQKDNVKNRRISSGYKGVSRYRYGDGWVARISSDGQLTNIGVFDDVIAAANAYNTYAEEEHGSFARLNEVPHMDRQEWESHLITKERTLPVGIRIAKSGRYTAYVSGHGGFKTMGTFEKLDDAVSARDSYLSQLIKGA